MATAELTQAAPRDTANPRHPSPGGRCHRHDLIAVALTACTATLVGVALGVVAPELAPSGRPHPTLHGTLREALGILATNLRVLAAPVLLALFGLGRGRRSQLLGDVLVAGLVLANTLRVGAAIGRFGTRLLPYLPHLPLEWLALTLCATAWLQIRTGASTRVVCLYAIATLAAAVAAASCETLLTPHPAARSHNPGRRATTTTENSCRPSPCWICGGGCLRPDFAPAAALLTSRSHSLPSPRIRSVPLGRHAGASGLPSTTTDPTGGTSMNSVHLIGRLTTDPELQDRSGTPVGRLRLAVQRTRSRDGEDRGADYVDVTVFNTQAEVCSQYLAKGRRVAVEGRLQHSEWQAEDGSRRQKLEVVARNVEFLDRKPAEDPQPQAADTAA